MAYWLVKQEPTGYSWDDLVRDGGTRWDGVHNNAALLHLRGMAPGDEALMYHSGEQRSCVGILRIQTVPQLDTGDSRRSWFVDVAPVRPLKRPVSLAEIRADPAFADLALLRMSRLSVMPVPERAWKRLLLLSERPAPSEGAPTAASKGRARARAPRARGTAAKRRR